MYTPGLLISVNGKQTQVPVLYQSNYRDLIRICTSNDSNLFWSFWDAFIAGFADLNILEKSSILLEVYLSFIEPSLKLKIDSEQFEIKWDHIDILRDISKIGPVIERNNVQIICQIPTRFGKLSLFEWVTVDGITDESIIEYLTPNEVVVLTSWIKNIDQRILNLFKTESNLSIISLSNIGDVFIRIFSEDILNTMEFERFFISRFNYSITDLNNYTPIELKIHHKQLVAKLNKQHEQQNTNRSPHNKAQKQSEHFPSPDNI